MPAVSPIPPPGIAVPDDVRAELTAGAAELAKEIAALRAGSDRQELLPDVEIFHKAVDWALRYDEFFDRKQFDVARKLIAQGLDRVKSLRAGQAPWGEQTGLVVRGYRSEIDGSSQPYGLVIPDGWRAGKPTRVDFWLHGRGEKTTELAFLEDRMTKRGEFDPPDAIVVHLYGRFCNANKFAGERDLFEVLRELRKQYPVDEHRLSVRGFSMGGASCWQFGTHFAGQFAAVAPGAGFGETAEFLQSFAEGKTPPPWWEQVLWRWYDSTLYAGNLFNTTVVAYSGEVDRQRQAAEIMSKYMAKEGLTLTHLIGPGMGHKYFPETKPKIEEIVTAAATNGSDDFPAEVKFTTYSPLYWKMKWVEVQGLEKSWERADVDARREAGKLTVTTKNVRELKLSLPPAKELLSARPSEVLVDGQSIRPAWVSSNPKPPIFAWTVLMRDQGAWKASEGPGGLRKHPGLCGPIDHAFMSSFLMVRPTGQALNEKVGAWTKAEMEHAAAFWRAVYRGEAPMKDDRDVSQQDLQNSNLILWGDPASNTLLGRILAKLPLKWDAKSVKLATADYPAANHAPILIFPNPLNPQRYVVINSGITFREKALLNNADQTPKLPDWAVVNLDTPPGPEWPGLVMDAGFFNERWEAP